MGRQRPHQLEDLWFVREVRVGPLERWMAALQQVVLPQVAGRIVVFIDEIDAVRSLSFSTDEFFAAIRECYNRRTQDPAFERLTFCLLGVASPSDLIRDTRMTPFNIGRRIELTDFTEAEAAPLTAGLGGQAFRRSSVQVPTKSDPSDPSDPSDSEHLNARTRKRLPVERLTRFVRLASLPAGTASFTDRSPLLANGQPQSCASAAVFPAAGGSTAEGPRVSLQATPVALPPGWLGCSTDEGLHAGSAFFDAPAGPILIRGSGADIWDRADQYYYLYQPVQGNFRITVRALTRPKATDPWAKAGLMIRESTAAGARDGFLMTTPANGLHFQWRGAANASCDDAPPVLADKQLRVPILLRLTRQGDTVTASYSPDGGRRFLPAGHPLSFDEPLPGTVYAGLAITAHNPDRVSEARFDDLRVETR